MNGKQKIFLKTFGFVVLALGLVRLMVSPSSPAEKHLAAADTLTNRAKDSLEVHEDTMIKRQFSAIDWTEKHKIYSVRNYKEAFPDSNETQMRAARKWGVEPARDREDAELRKNELVYVGANPYYHVEQMKQSIPYLVPRAAVLLQDIGRNYFDSLQAKRIPLHRPIITSITRTKHDVARLRNYNRNATENSCHLYATTFDITYNRYHPVGRQVRNDTLKFVLSEVLNDLRRQGRCYIKYEVKQGCFHITVR